MTLDGDGRLTAQRSAKGFAKHYGPEGQPILGPDDVDVPPDAEIMSLLPSDTPTHTVRGRPEVLEAIDQTAIRYAGHPALRRADLTVNDWRAFFRSNIEIESGYNPSARSHVGAIGLGQLMPDTARTLGVNPNIPHENLDGSARYMLMLLARFGSKELALAGYNAGPEAVAKYGGIPPYAETRSHVTKVMAVFHRLKQGAF